MKQISKYIKVVNGALLAGSLLLTACTSHFESWNINPNEVIPEQMERDNLKLELTSHRWRGGFSW